jgi:hypothetical protein
MLAGKSYWKRDVLTKKINIPHKFWNLIDNVSIVRENIANIVSNKLKLPLTITNKSNNPGLILKHHKELFELSYSEVIKLGMKPQLFEQAIAFYRYGENAARNFLEKSFAKKGYNYKKVKLNWIKNVCEIPRPISLEKYEFEKKEFLNRCSSEVIAVYEFGNIGSPGLSDMDFLVVLSDEYYGIPSLLTIQEFDKQSAEIISHNPLFISVSNIEKLGLLTPLFHCKQIFGNHLKIPKTSEGEKYYQEICYTLQNLVKYPDDLIWLSKQPQIRWKTILAYLNSFNHIHRTITLFSDFIPESIIKCVELNTQIRKNFLSGKISIEDLDLAFSLMIDAISDLVYIYSKFWAKKLSYNLEINKLVSFSDNYKNQLHKCIKSSNVKFPQLPEHLEIFRRILRGRQLDQYENLNLTKTIKEYLAKFISVKRAYVESELIRGRVISYYIADKYETDNLILSINQQKIEKAEDYIQNNFLDDAKNLLLDVLKLNPQNLLALNNLAVINILKNNFKNAEIIINAILKIDPKNEVALRI